jgi:hypothetical protein
LCALIQGDLTDFRVLSRLTTLRLEGTGVGGTLAGLATALPSLVNVSLRRCARVEGDVGDLAPMPSLKEADVRGCPRVTELPMSWLLRFLRRRVRRPSPKVQQGWPPWGHLGDWRTCYDRLHARPESGSYWIGKKFPALAAEWDAEVVEGENGLSSQTPKSPLSQPY